MYMPLRGWLVGARENMCDSRLRRESRRFSGWVTSRGEHEDSTTTATGNPEGGVGVQGRGRVRGGARSAKRRRNEEGRKGEMADHARSIYQNTPAPART